MREGVIKKRMETYVARVSHENLRLFQFFSSQKKSSVSSQFDFNLALPDIIANKTSGENAIPDNFVSNHMHPSPLP